MLSLTMLRRATFRRFVHRVACLAWAATAAVASAAPAAPCRIEVVDQENGWPAPLVELRTVHGVRFVTDNAGVIAFDLPELMGRETWFHVDGHGYGVPRDGFGNRGIRLTPQPGETLRVELQRTNIAKRLGRITGAGLFAESQMLGEELDWPESGVVGCDTVQNAVYKGKMYWLWGDTSLTRYPMGIFHSTSATSAVQPLNSFEPPLRLKLKLFTDAKGQPRGVAEMPGDGPTWITGYTTLPDKAGKPRLVGVYAKIRGKLEEYDRGLVVWNDETESFDKLKTVWTKSASSPRSPTMPNGHPAFYEDEAGRRWVLYGNPLPFLRCPATFEAWQDASQWEELPPQKSLPSADGVPVAPHTGSIAWNEHRQRWVTVFMEKFGQPSAFGELWYAEAKSPYGPWGPAVKVLSHDNYTFYNPRLHPEFTPADSPILQFEGTYTQEFANRPHPTPRYDYNQILYRLDLDDPKLAAARQ